MNDETMRVDQWNGVQLQKYKDTFQVLAMTPGGGEDAENVWYKQWVFLSRWENGQGIPDEDKRRPMGIRLGDKETALNILKKLYHTIDKLT